ncbi:MAG: bifunctional glutamate N-acetyltransferase/amino-acid acetyltransferase ArgJ [Streptomycetaceae bacterium]|nr:MAG: bifunctional glutamate N-acetyltransferase/amino-acid acetyltransferase ArgJ [Streptomycetaceae bacterium]
MNFPQGFRSGAVAAGLKSNGALDLTIIENFGPTSSCAGVFTSNKVVAAPVTWTKQIVKGGAIRSVILNSGGANACTGPQGFADTHLTAETVASALRISSSEVAVCSTGLIGELLPMPKVLAGIKAISSSLSVDSLDSSARAIMTTDTKPKLSSKEILGATFTGIAKGAGMLAPALATMLSVVMTDAVVDEKHLQEIFTRVCNRTFNRIDSDGCTSTNDTVLLMASGSSGVHISDYDLEQILMEVCGSLATQLIGDAEGHTKIVSIEVINAGSEDDAVAVGRACARNNLLKCALFGGDPNWGRILAALGTADADFDPTDVDVSLNQVMVSRSSGPGEDRNLVDLSGVNISILIDLKFGSHSATIHTNDLSHDYVEENSAYAT